MILFGFIAIVLLMWILNISYQLKLLVASSALLETEIREGAASCGKSIPSIQSTSV